jgi:hypothetical protein
VNRIRLLKLDETGRKQYILQEFNDLPIHDLRHYASEYGIRGVREMGKVELIEAIISGLQDWAETEILK